MDDTAKYLIHAQITADGIVERSDVVGAIFGQTEGLLGDELDLRDLRRSQKVGRIDVDIEGAEGQVWGELTIASGLDKVETATLAAALETISRVGPCRAEIAVEEIEDVRAAKRKAVVDRAKELLRTSFGDSVMSSEEILTEVREHVRVADITEFEGLPAGPRVTDSDAIIVVEGRADVLTLLKYGIKNAIAVEGTDVPDAVAELTQHRTVTAFLDGDRGGDLILEELTQVGDVDYVAFAPSDESVEKLGHSDLFAALRNKVPLDVVADSSDPRDLVAATDGSARPAPAPTPAGGVPTGPTQTNEQSASADSAEPSATEAPSDGASERSKPATVYGHGTQVIGAETGQARLLTADATPIAECPAGDVYDELADAEAVPATIVLDGIATQRLVDLAADRGVDRIVADSLGQFTKRPTDVRVHRIADVAAQPPD